VQLRERADLASGQWTGRVEHVTSGQAIHFQSLEELLAFVVRVLTSPSARASDK